MGQLDVYTRFLLVLLKPQKWEKEKPHLAHPWMAVATERETYICILILTTNPAFYIKENWGSETVSNLPSVTAFTWLLQHNIWTQFWVARWEFEITIETQIFFSLILHLSHHLDKSVHHLKKKMIVQTSRGQVLNCKFKSFELQETEL